MFQFKYLARLTIFGWSVFFSLYFFKLNDVVSLYKFCFPRENTSVLLHFIGNDDENHILSSLVMAFFFSFFFFKCGPLLPKWLLLKLHQNRVRNEVGAPSKSTLCSRLVKVICWITLAALVVLISGFHVSDFWWLFRLVIWEMFFWLLPLSQALNVSLIHIMGSLSVLAFFFSKSSAGSSSNTRLRKDQKKKRTKLYTPFWPIYFVKLLVALGFSRNVTSSCSGISLPP